MRTLSALKPAAAAALRRWLEMVATRDLRELPELLREDAVYLSPLALTPFPGARAVATFLDAALSVLEGFIYDRQFAADDGLSVALEFVAVVEGKQLRGVDLIRFDDDGKIAELEMMVRPISGANALAEAVRKQLEA